MTTDEETRAKLRERANELSRDGLTYAQIAKKLPGAWDRTSVERLVKGEPATPTAPATPAPAPAASTSSTQIHASAETRRDPLVIALLVLCAVASTISAAWSIVAWNDRQDFKHDIDKIVSIATGDEFA